MTRRGAAVLMFIGLTWLAITGIASRASDVAQADLEHNHQPVVASGQIEALPVAVDGAKNPERIPDAMAYRHFLRAIAIHVKPSQDELARQDMLIGRIGLSAGDRDALKSAMESVREQLDAINEERQRVSSGTQPTPWSMAALRVQEQSLLDNSRVLVANSLSVDGAGRLDAHVQQHVKRSIVIYGNEPR